MSRRVRFLSKLMKNVLLPYEVSDKYVEKIIGKFENHYEKAYFQYFVKLVGLRAHILDLACGDGRHTLQLSMHLDQIVALDLSQNNLKMAREKCLARENIAFIQGSMLELPFLPSTFDGIWYSQAFEYVPPDWREMFLCALNRILRPSGLLFMSVETWMHPSLVTSLKELWNDFKLFFYWKFLKYTPLLWGEFLYYLSLKFARVKCSGWHYHVHTDKWTLYKLVSRCGFVVEKLNPHNGYIYVLCRKTPR
ncbi:MAG: class I SAM-dependent methyltransferase [Candidatus Heimdallarchaeota archaeon]